MYEVGESERDGMGTSSVRRRKEKRDERAKHSPKVASGLSSLTLVRCSWEKIMYEERALRKENTEEKGEGERVSLEFETSCCSFLFVRASRPSFARERRVSLLLGSVLIFGSLGFLVLGGGGLSGCMRRTEGRKRRGEGRGGGRGQHLGFLFRSLERFENHPPTIKG